MKLNEVIAKYGNQEVDESKIKEVLGVKESKVWEPKNGDRYWFVHANGDTCTTIFVEKHDVKMVNFGNVFKTEKEAIFARDKQIFLTKFERYLRENEDEPVDWGNDGQAKYSVEFNCRINSKICVAANNYYMKQGAIYTTNFEALNSYVKENESDIKKYMFGVEERK